MTDSFPFSLTSLDTEALLPQVSAALNQRAELHSRQKLPGLWKVTDRLSHGKPAAQDAGHRRKNFRLLMGLLQWVLGLLLLVPGLMDLQALWVLLLVGVFAFSLGQLTIWLYHRTLLGILDLACGLFLCMSALGSPDQLLYLLWVAVPCLLLSIAVLPSQRRQPSAPFESEARNVLARYQNLPPHSVQAVFTHDGLTVSHQDGAPSVYPYSTMSFVLETTDLLLPFFQNTVLLLPKSGLTSGSLEELRTFLAQYVRYEVLETAPKI